ncbi:MAG: hypothetical protein AB7P01_12735, partial [Bacteroidia bacterium]
MRKLLLIAFAIINCQLSVFNSYAQAPQKFNYQGVARDNSGNILAEQPLGLRISISSESHGGSPVYVETQQAFTNKFGLFNIEIGGGSVVSGVFSEIEWGAGNYYVQVEMDAAGGTDYEFMGISQLLSVPYALYSEKSGTALDAEDRQPTPVTLNLAYNADGAGAGRIINATNGSVNIEGTDGLMVKGTHGSGNVVNAAGAGTRMFFYPKRSAFRAGYVNGANWDNASIGIYSFASGYDTKATGEASFASGTATQATGNRSTAMGNSSKATGYISTAIGSQTIASGNTATALGYSTNASGTNSTALGSFTNASGTNSTAMGAETSASGSGSTAMGVYTTASGINSTAMGQGTTASGNFSTAMGDRTTAKSTSETAIGSWNTNYNPFSTNAWYATDRLFVIGNGTDIDNPSNAMVVLKNGNTGIGNINPDTKLDIDGQIKIRGGSPGANKVLTSDANGLASWQTLPVPASAGGTLDAAYDFGGAGLGRIIDATHGSVNIEGTDGFMVKGTHGSGNVVNAAGSGTRMFFYPKRSAFRVGYVFGSNWDNANIG